MSPADLRTFMSDKSVIPVDPKLNVATIDGLAQTMQPGDAKALVQALAKLGKTDRTRIEVIQALNAEIAGLVKAVQQKLSDPAAAKSGKAASKETIPLRKTGS